MTKAKNAVCHCFSSAPDCLARFVFIRHSLRYAFDISSENEQFVGPYKRQLNPFVDRHCWDTEQVTRIVFGIPTPSNTVLPQLSARHALVQRITFAFGTVNALETLSELLRLPDAGRYIIPQ